MQSVRYATAMNPHRPLRSPAAPRAHHAAHRVVRVALAITACVFASPINAQESAASVEPATAPTTTRPSAAQEPSQFHSLFDGKTLTGWTESGGRYDGDADWSVEDGAITGREGAGNVGGLLYTERHYSNFVFTGDVKIKDPFDSGLFLRMVPPELAAAQGGGKGAQITLDVRDGGEVGAIYADGFLTHNQTAKDKVWKRDGWNTFKVVCDGSPGMHIQAWINGTEVCDFTLLEDQAAFAPAGRIGLQVHGARGDPATRTVQFKNLHVRDLASHDPELFAQQSDGSVAPTPVAEKLGWKSLFGDTLDGMHAVDDGGNAKRTPEPGSNELAGYELNDGVLHLTAAGPGGSLRTNELLADFQATLDFKITKGCNSGLFLRGNPSGGNPAFSGCEVQILDDFNWETMTKSTLHPWQFTGSLYGSVAAPRGALRPIGEWNTYFVHYKGSHLRVTLNGNVLYDVDTNDVPLHLGEAKPFAKRAQQGFLGLQRHGAAHGSDHEDAAEPFASFRNIFVRRL